MPLWLAECFLKIFRSSFSITKFDVDAEWWRKEMTTRKTLQPFWRWSIVLFKCAYHCYLSVLLCVPKHIQFFSSALNLVHFCVALPSEWLTIDLKLEDPNIDKYTVPIEWIQCVWPARKGRQTFTSPPKALQTVSVGAAVCCCLRSSYLHGNGLAWPLWGDASVTLADINWRCVCDASAHLSERGCAACVFWKWQRQRGGGGCVDFFGVH